MRKTTESTNCPYCLSPIGEAESKVRCPVCGVVHHEECWRDNGKCSVYGCDGWQAWSGAIADKIAPKIADDISLDQEQIAVAERPTPTGPLCIKCGKPVKQGQLHCWKCGRDSHPGWLENCGGPSVIALGVLIALAMLLLKGLS